MSARGEQLADELQRVTDEVIASVEVVPDAAWHDVVTAEQCTVAALACHIASGYRNILDRIVRPNAEGREGPRLSWEDLAQWNAEAALENAEQSKAVALERLRTLAPPAIAYVRGLSDAQLQRVGTLPTGGDPLTTEDAIVHVLIRHPRGHLGSMPAPLSERPDAASTQGATEDEFAVAIDQGRRTI